MSPIGNVCLDTSVIVDYFRGDHQIGVELEAASALYVPAIVAGELLYGAFRSAYREKQERQITVFLQSTSILGVNFHTSQHYGHIRAELAAAGQMIPENDLWIAALAIQHGLPLATRDEHFRWVSALTAIFW